MEEDADFRARLRTAYLEDPSLGEALIGFSGTLIQAMEAMVNLEALEAAEEEDEDY